MAFRLFKNRYEFYIFQISETEPAPPTVNVFFNASSPNTVWHLDNGWVQNRPTATLSQTVWAAMCSVAASESTITITPSQWKVIEFPALVSLGDLNPSIPEAQKDNPSEHFQRNFKVTKDSLSATAEELEYSNLRLRYSNITGSIALDSAVSDAIDAAVNQVLNSQLLADLQEGISTNVPTLIAEAEARLEQATNLLSNEVGNLQVLVNDTIPEIIDDVSDRLNQAVFSIGENAAAIQTETNIRIDEVEAVANQVTVIAASRNRVFYSDQTPTASAIGDLWFKTDENNKAFRWDGTSWVDVSDQRIVANAAAIITEQTARITADEAIASQITTLVSSIEGNTAAIQSESIARSTADEAIAEQIDTLVASVGDNAAAIQSESLARADAISAEAQRIDTLVVAVGDNAAAIQSEAITRANAISAEAQRIDTLVVAVGDNAAAIQSEAITRANAISAEAQRIDALVVSVGDNTAAISSESTARANADNALAEQIDTLVVSVGDNAAAIQTESITRANEVSAVAGQVSTLSATVGDNTAAIQVSQEVIDGLSAQFMVKTDVNGYVSGFGLYNQGAEEGSDFIVLADRFAIVTPGDNPVVPFSADANGVFIPEAFIRDLNVEKINGQVVGEQIANGAISGPKITADAIDGKVITGALIQTSATGLRVVLGDANFPIWYGNGTVNANNGLFYTDNAGGIVAKDSFKITVGGTDRLFFDPQSNQLTIRAKLVLSDGTELEDAGDILGQPGADGESVLVVYATSAAGANQSLTPGSREYIQYVSYTGTPPSLPVSGTFIKFVGDPGPQGPQGPAGVDGADGADGAAGANARSVDLTATAQVVEYNSINARVGPTSITFTATPQNLSGTAFYRFYVNDVAQGGGPTTTATFSYTTPTTFFSTPVKIEVEVREGSTGGTIVARDQMSVYAVRPGANSVTGILSNEAHTVPASSTGTVTSYANSGTTIQAFDGVTALSFETGTGFPTVNGRFRVTSSATNITRGAISGGGTTTATVANASNMTADTASIVYTINARTAEGQNIAITKTQTFSKSREGQQGATGPTGPAGNNGIDGASGAGFYSVSVATTKPTITTAYLSNLFVNKAGRQPLTGDTLFVSWTNAADAYEFNGSAWVTATLVVNGNIIASGTISGAALQADAINGKTITGATFITTNVGSDFVRITASDAFGNSGDLLEWFGPKISGVTWNFGSNIPILAGMSKSNAKTYTTVNGDVFFGGTFVAGVLSSAQSTSLSSPTASVQMTFSSQGGLINMAASLSYNRQYFVEDPNNSNNWTSLCPASLPSAPTGTLFLERWNGSSWTIVQQQAITGTVACIAGASLASNGTSWPKVGAAEPGVPAEIIITGSRSFTYIDNLQTTNNRQYRARVNLSNVLYNQVTQFVSVTSSEG